MPGAVWVLFSFALFVFAYVSKNQAIRRKYVNLLDVLFRMVAVAETIEEYEEEGTENTAVVVCPECPRSDLQKTPSEGFSLDDMMLYASAGMRAVVDDCYTRTLMSEQPKTWNMLSRTRQRRTGRGRFQLSSMWFLGCFFRYGLLMPARMAVFILSLANLVVCTTAVGLLPDSTLKRKVNAAVIVWCFEFMADGLTVVANFHNPENRPKHGIAVANHTSPLDMVVLLTDNCYDMVGQKSKGLLGIYMKALAKSSSHIWFDRLEIADRSNTQKRLIQHAYNESLPPIIVFPEGICVNNTAVFPFRKGVFEADSVISPIAIRFDRRYSDVYWWQNDFFTYLFHMFTSWAIVCEIWYLPPVRRLTYETPQEFANRVRTSIAQTGKLNTVAFDGYMKLSRNSEKWKIKKTEWIKKQQKEYARHLINSNRSHSASNAFM